jgi:hydrogenase maturation protein HypF
MAHLNSKNQGAEGGESGRTRLRIRCTGFVQGVGFRPAVHRLATSMGLAGWVLNGPDGVVIEVEGTEDSPRRFAQALHSSLPPLASLESMSLEPRIPLGETSFEVRTSELGPRGRALVPPDAAVCGDCRREMDEASGRRFRYPFTTCTNCGPRFSLVRSLPYDRERTSMSCFPLCEACRREYENPLDRRFHAEPVCCPECGPRLWICAPDGARLALGAEALEKARRALAQGAIVAVKGMGGFQLACCASDKGAVAELRARKHRPRKPFAVMVRDLAVARNLVQLSVEGEALMASPRSPVVLAPRRSPSPLAPNVAPGIGDLGLLLPTTPLHAELFRGAPYDALVMTSGNLSEEPICLGNREALARLSKLTDLFLLHDRDILRRVDDSVVRLCEGEAVMVRRARGYVPEPLELPKPASEPVLALGGHLQVTACLAAGDRAFLSQHVGDLEGDAARNFLVEAALGLEDFLDVQARLFAVDGHPDYPSAWKGEEMARQRGGRLLRFQHHLAHAAAVLAENGVFPQGEGTAVALILDGTGWGPDGEAWGAEWLLLEGAGGWWRRPLLSSVPLVGGEQAVRAPWRVAAAALALEDSGLLGGDLPMYQLVPRALVAQVGGLAKGAWPMACGAGRLFEAAGALAGLASENDWEGEAAARFETLAAQYQGPAPFWDEVALKQRRKEMILPFGALLAAAVRRLLGGEEPAAVAAGFHETFCRLAVRCRPAAWVARGPGAVALGGGCLVNRLLLGGLKRALGEEGAMVVTAHRLPPGDGGLSYGQAVLACSLPPARTGWELRSP